MPAKILIVEDSATQALKTKCILGEYDFHHVRIAQSGPEALGMVEEQPPDVILLDIIMPGMDGYELLERLRENDKYATIQIIMLTVKDNIESVTKSLDIGADDYLHKGCDPKELVARVRASLRVKRLYEKLIKAERLAAIGQLAVTMNHTINNILTGIIGTCQLMDISPDVPDNIKKKFELIRQQGMRIRDTVRKISELKDTPVKQYLDDIQMIDIG